MVVMYQFNNAVSVMNIQSCISNWFDTVESGKQYMMVQETVHTCGQYLCASQCDKLDAHETKT